MPQQPSSAGSADAQMLVVEDEVVLVMVEFVVLRLVVVMWGVEGRSGGVVRSRRDPQVEEVIGQLSRTTHLQTVRASRSRDHGGGAEEGSGVGLGFKVPG